MRYTTLDDVLDNDDIIDFDLPEDKLFDESTPQYDYDEDDVNYDADYEHEPSEYTEWMDYDPDC